MKVFRWFLPAIFSLLFFCSDTSAQITNLTVNGFSANFSSTQGQGTAWECNIPTGGTMICEIWADLNGNGVIDPATDKSIFGVFTQTDGDASGKNGPGDMDSLVNGHLILTMPDFDLAPGKYVLRFSNNNVVSLVTGTVNPMISPAYTISGTIIPPPSFSSKNIIITGEGKESGNFQTLALTDASGNYTLNFTQRAAGVKYSIYIRDNFSPYTSTPTDTAIVLSKSYSGVNFSFAQPVAKIVGYLKGEDGKALADVRISTWPNNGNYSDRNTTTDGNGFFQFGYSAADIAAYPVWRIQADNNMPPAYLSPQSVSISLHVGDSLRIDLTGYLANDSLKGTVYVDGNIPNNISFRVFASVSDSGFTQTNSNPVTGAFTLYVTKKLFNYYLGFNDLPSQYGYDWYNPLYHPGDKNIKLNVSTISWFPQTTQTNNRLNAVFFVNGTKGWAAGSNGTLIATSDGGASWSPKSTNTNTTINGLFFVNSSTGWFVGNGGVIKKTTDGGNSWTSLNSTTTGDLLAVQFVDQNTGWAVGGNLGQAVMLKTTDGGNTWNTQYNGNSGTIYSLSMMNANVGWALWFGSLIHTSDGGATWMPVNGASGYAVRFADQNTGWVVGMGSQICTTHDGGANWATQYLNASNLRSIHCINASTAWTVGDNGSIFMTTDGGTSWKRELVNTNYSNTNLASVWFVDAKNGWIAGDNGLILNTTLGGVSLVSDNRPNAQGKQFLLAQNYPNPFNAATVITYRLSAESKVTLTVYDILGNEIAVLVNATKPAGTYSTNFNASGLSTGIYFYRLKAGPLIETKKLLLLK